METSDWISVIALLLAIISMVGQFLLSRRSNNIQSETFRLSKKIDDFDNRKGEMLMLNIIGRYFILTWNCFEPPPSGKMRKDKASLGRYLSGLKQLSYDFNELINNPFFIKFIETHPDINLLILSLRGAIIEMEDKKEIGINSDTFRYFYDIYENVKKEISNTETLEHNFFKAIDEAKIILQKVILGTN
jgi:hypothetical protein